MSPAVFAILSIILSAIAQLALKSGMGAPNIQASIRSGADVTDVLLGAGTNVMVILGLALYGVGAALWLLVLARWDVSKAYPFVGLGFLITMVLGICLLGERVSLARALGTLMVVGGVLLVSRT